MTYLLTAAMPLETVKGDGMLPHGSKDQTYHILKTLPSIVQVYLLALNILLRGSLKWLLRLCSAKNR